MFSILKFTGAQVTRHEHASAVFTFSISMFRYVSACIYDLCTIIIQCCLYVMYNGKGPFCNACAQYPRDPITIFTVSVGKSNFILLNKNKHSIWYINAVSIKRLNVVRSSACMQRSSRLQSAAARINSDL